MLEEDFKINKDDDFYWVEMKRLGITAMKSERRVGRIRAIENPEEMWALACDYFQDVDDNPYQREDYVRGGNNAGQKIYINMPRPYSWPGFERYLVQRKILVSLNRYRTNMDEAYDDFIPILEKIDTIMFEQKFEGAAMGVFNATIISRDLNLAEITETRHSISNKKEIDYSQLSDEALDEIAQQFEIEEEDKKDKKDKK